MYFLGNKESFFGVLCGYNLGRGVIKSIIIDHFWLFLSCSRPDQLSHHNTQKMIPYSLKKNNFVVRSS